MCIGDLLVMCTNNLILSEVGGRRCPPTTRSNRDLLPYQLEQTGACQRNARLKDGEMKDGNVDEMEGCDGQGHISMATLHQRDVDGDGDGDARTSRSLAQRVKDRNRVGQEQKKEKKRKEKRGRVTDGKQDRFGLC